MDKDYVLYSRIKVLIEKYKGFFKSEDYEKMIIELAEILGV